MKFSLWLFLFIYVQHKCCSCFAHSLFMLTCTSDFNGMAQSKERENILGRIYRRYKWKIIVWNNLCGIWLSIPASNRTTTAFKRSSIYFFWISTREKRFKCRDRKISLSLERHFLNDQLGIWYFWWCQRWICW